MMKWLGVLGIACMTVVQGFGDAATLEKAVGLADQGRINDAIALLEKPADNEARVMLARLLDYDGQTDQAITTLQDGLCGAIEDLDLLDTLLSIYTRRGEEGPTVSHKRGSVSYSPSTDEAAEAAWKREQYQLAVETCDRALKHDPEMDYFIYHKAAALTAIENYEAATTLYKKMIERYPEGAELRTEIAAIYFNRGMTNEAVASLEKAIELNPRAVEARQALSEHLTRMGQLAEAVEQDQKASFYGWLPPFINLEYTTNHFATYEVLSGTKELAEEERVKVVDELIGAVDDDGAMSFLAALCYHHADHGALETRAFKALEERGEVAYPLLLQLFETATSTCTAGQAAGALANQKCGLAVEPLIESLPRDVRFMWNWNAAEHLATLGDPRAVPELIRIADVRTELSEAEDDPMHGFQGRMSARWRAAFALGAFHTEQTTIEPVLLSGLANPQMAAICRAALYRLTGDETYANKIGADLELDDADYYQLKITLNASEDPRAETLMGMLPEEKE